MSPLIQPTIPANRRVACNLDRTQSLSANPGSIDDSTEGDVLAPNIISRGKLRSRFTRGITSIARSPVKDIILLDSPYRFWAVQLSNASATRLAFGLRVRANSHTRKCLRVWMRSVYAVRNLARFSNAARVTHAVRVRARTRRIHASTRTRAHTCILRTIRATLRTHYTRAYAVPRWLGFFAGLCGTI